MSALDGERQLVGVVGIGASAGGLAALERLVGALPPRTGLALAIVQHLPPGHASRLAPLLARYTDLPVSEVRGEELVRPDHVYTIPSGHLLRYASGRLVLEDRPQASPLAVDHLLRSLAAELGPRAVAVVLSGTGRDGTEGLAAVARAGGLTLAQDPDSAEFDGMPLSAIETGRVAETGAPAELAAVLARHAAAGLGVARSRPTQTLLAEAEPEGFRQVLERLRIRAGHDFRDYKLGTLSRRLQRRIRLQRLGSIEAYLAFLDEQPEELEALRNDFLVNVTRFFRDPAAWRALREQVLTPLVAEKPAEEPIRVWVPGCSTGEEAYGIAMLLLEEHREQDRPADFQVFATDRDEEALEVARRGVYEVASTADVPADLLGRHFARAGVSSYRASRVLRDRLVIARQDLLTDPPFSRLDLVSCRNVMIYLRNEVQQRMLLLFRFALLPGGTLFLGTSETAGQQGTGFELLSQEWRLYRRLDGPAGRSARTVTPSTAHPHPGASAPRSTSPTMSSDQSPRNPVVDLAHRVLLERFSPPSVVVDRTLRVRYFHGPLRDFLDLPGGEPTLELHALCLPGLRTKVRVLVSRAFEVGTEQSGRALGVRRGDTTVDVLLTAVPLQQDGETLMLVGFQDVVRARSDGDAAPHGQVAGGRTAGELERELRGTQADLESTIAELEASNEHLKASNERILTVNEELQSANEELETSREELQSLNEELTTVNSQLEENVDELEHANNDLTNLLNSTEIATVFLDTEFRIRRFSPATQELLHVLDGDVGRPIRDLAPRFNDPDLLRDARTVLHRLQPVEKRIWLDHASGGDGARAERWFIRRILPYRTSEERIEGVVLTFTDVTELQLTLSRLERREQQGAVVAEIGRAALTEDSLQTILDLAMKSVTEVLDCDFSKVLQRLPGRRALLLRAGFGWRPGLVGNAEIHAGRNSQAGYALERSAPVLIEDLAAETRFRPSSLLVEHGVVSGISVVIGPVDQPWGVFGVHSARDQRFTAEDANFVQAVANVLWESIVRREQEDALRDRERQLRLVTDSMPVLIAYCDRDYVYRFCNARYTEWFGLERNEIVGKHVVDVIGAEAFERARDQLERVLQGERVVYETVMPYRLGGARHVQLSLVPHEVPGGDVLGYFAMIEDLSDRRRQERALAESEQRLQMAKEAAGLGIHDFDVARGVVRWDERIQAIWGLGPEVRYEDFRAGLHPDDRERTERAVQAALDPQGDGKYRALYRVLHRATGQVKWVEATGLVTFQEERPVRLVGTVLDVTERQRIQEALKESEERKDTFLAVLGHELRNPLAAILHSVTGLRAVDADSGNADLFATIRHQAEHMRHLLNDLLDVGRITRGELLLDRRPVPVREHVDRAVEMVRGELDARGHALEVEVAPPDLRVLADPVRLEQIVVNLLGNAAKYTPEPGRVALRAHVDGEQVCLVVQDTGIGLTAEQRARVFSEFYQANKGSGGLGLGLSLVKTLAALHDGDVEVGSDGPGRGTRVIVRLPVAEASARVEPERGGGADGRAAGALALDEVRLLLVEDHVPSLKVLGRLLAGSCRLATAASGSAALTAAAAERPDVVVLDLSLPDMSGLELAAALAERCSPPPPCIAMTGFGDDDTAEQVRAAGLAGFLLKPVDVDELLAVVRRSLQVEG